MCEVNSDSKVVVESLMGLIPSPWTVQAIIEDTKVLLAQLQGVRVSYAPREANKSANWVAKAYRDNRLPQN